MDHWGPVSRFPALATAEHFAASGGYWDNGGNSELDSHVYWAALEVIAPLAETDVLSALSTFVCEQPAAGRSNWSCHPSDRLDPEAGTKLAVNNNNSAFVEACAPRRRVMPKQRGRLTNLARTGSRLDDR